MRGGAVPVYKGAPEVLQHVPLRSVILADDFADAAALGAHLNALVADEAAYRRHFEWDLQEFAARPTVAQCPWQCRVCEMLLARREGRREPTPATAPRKSEKNGLGVGEGVGVQ